MNIWNILSVVYDVVLSLMLTPQKENILRLIMGIFSGRYFNNNCDVWVCQSVIHGNVLIANTRENDDKLFLSNFRHRHSGQI